MKTWQEKQPKLFELLSKIIQKNRLAHAYLLDGGNGVGKEECAIWLVQSRFCENLENGLPCGECNNCKRVARQEHPDVFFVEPDGNFIKVEQIRVLQEEFAKSSMEGAWKAFVIIDADKMNLNAANSLLKFLEEPNPQTLAILQTSTLAKVLPTICSRVQIFHFTPLSKKALQNELIAQGVQESLAIDLAEITNDLEKALVLSQDEAFFERRKIIRRFFDYLIKGDWNGFVYVQKTMMKTWNSKELKDVEKKQLQKEALDFLMIFSKRAMRETGKLRFADVCEKINQAQVKYNSNVNFQNVLELLAIEILSEFS